MIELQCGRVNLPKSSPQQANNRIMGGFNVTENKYPWVVSLQVILPGKSELTHVCTGSILSKTAILTAAHCDLTQRGLTHHIVFGTNDNRLTKGNIKAKKVIPHPDYNTTTLTYDAMILILEEPITFTKDVGPICLPDNDKVQENVCTWLIFHYKLLLKSISRKTPSWRISKTFLVGETLGNGLCLKFI